MQYSDVDERDPFERPIFEALLTPYRSLGRKGFTILMSVLIGCWLLFGSIFWSLGAWPIFGVFGLDVLLIYLAFRWNYQAAQAREEISVSRAALHIRQYSSTGKMTKHSFNPYWARFRIIRKPDIGIVSMRVENRDESVAIGSFLNPEDRENFARAFGNALSEVRR